MNQIDYTMIVLFISIIGMIGLLLFRYYKEQKNGIIEQNKNQMLLYIIKNIIQRLWAYVIQKKIFKKISNKDNYNYLPIKNIINNYIKKMYDALYGRSKIVREVSSSPYLNDIEKHKSNIQRLKDT